MDTISLNKIVDMVVPVYTVFVLFVIYSYSKSSASRSQNRIYTFVKKELEDANAPPRIYTLKDFAGCWNQEEAKGVDEWFLAKKKNLAVRLIAPTQFLKMRFNIEFIDEPSKLYKIKVTRDVGGRGNMENSGMGPVHDKIEESTPWEKGSGAKSRWAFDPATGTLTWQILESPENDGAGWGISQIKRTIDPKDPNVMYAVRCELLFHVRINDFSLFFNYSLKEWSIPWYGDKTYEEERKKNGPHGAIIRVKQLKVDY
jgi:hypothetical protein